MAENSGFKNIKFGDIDARTEMTDSPDLLIGGFLDENGYIDHIMDDRFYLIYGLKGSGKTAIGSRIKLISLEDKQLEVEQYTLERFNYNLFEGMSYNTPSDDGNGPTKKHTRKMPEVENNRSWEIILNVALLDMFSKDLNLESKGKGNIKEVIDGLRELGVLPAHDFSVIVKKMSKKSIMADIKVFKYENSTTIESSSAYDAAYDNLRIAVSDADLSKKHILIIDGVDSVVSEREIQKRVLSGLLHAASEINNELRQNNVNAKIVLLCRKDLLDMLKDPNKQKVIGDYGLELNWYDYGVDRNEINLIKLLNLRASLSLGRDVDIFDEFLTGTVGNKEVYKFILDYTRHIPRDIVRLIREIQKVYKDWRMTPQKYYTAIKAYSADYFYGEVQDELVGIMSSDEVETIFKLISEMRKYRTSKKEMEIKAGELGINLSGYDLDRLLSLLYDIGAIGNVRNVNGKDSYSFKYRDRWSTFNSRDELVIHLALQKALNVRGGYETNDVEYD